ncbi:hypothetical protein N7E81_06045 [Reichenbachiella carrageenanivorans]|uniref:Uncharacterized protein n=1 Tax=Reichenbachiella carrageenanivorans TaxID=2979869 RepID=A0ABY6D4C7_9BACT|nr:hypothetical protein [Reichenbachiella carrageenanivorans]UXX80659.1 hypothetical protein N7E81_06045 [Reichenbachiella carrageenanivorans]
MSVKENAVITVSLENGQLVLSDNEGNPFDPKHPEKFTTQVKPNGKAGWVAGKGISSLPLIKVDEGEDIFKKLPFEKDGAWECKIDGKHSGSAKYSITYLAEGSTEQVTIDPRLDIKWP